MSPAARHFHRYRFRRSEEGCSTPGRFVHRRTGVSRKCDNRHGLTEQETKLIMTRR